MVQLSPWRRYLLANALGIPKLGRCHCFNKLFTHIAAKVLWADVLLDLDLDSSEKVAGDVYDAVVWVVVDFDEENVVAASCAEDVTDFISIVGHFGCC